MRKWLPPVLAVLVLALPGAPGAAQPEWHSTERCRLTADPLPAAYARCGTVSVPLDPAAPDGATIAFSAATYASSSDPQPSGPSSASALNAKPVSAHGLPQDIWLVPVTGGDPTRLTNMLEDEPTIAWAPDGKQIAIIATGGLYVTSVAGGEPRKLGLGATLAQLDWR